MTIFSIGEQCSTLPAEDQATLTLLERLGQKHLVEHWPGPDQSIADKRRFLSQIRHLNARYPGGLQRYLSVATELLRQSAAGVSPYQGFQPRVPTGYTVDLDDPQFSELEALGLEQVNRCAFVLVAGGLGERLGFAGIKVALPAESATARTFLEVYAMHILALQRRSNQRLGTNRLLPLAIMTSDDTDAKTRQLLLDHDQFGFAEGQVTLLKQEPVAAIADPTPRLAISPDDPFALLTKPHGHGDVHTLLHQSGLARRWFEEGIRWVVFFQDTNALTFHAVLATLAISAREHLDVNSVVVPRRPGEAVGGLVRLVRDDSELTINVEYNLLDALLRDKTAGGGDVADNSGFSPYPGNTNVFAIALCNYTQTLERTEGTVPEFINPKYTDASRTSFKRPSRLECMMQDYPRLVPHARVACTQFDRSICFSPVKNGLEESAARTAQNPPLPAESAATGEADVYFLHRQLLRFAGADMADGPAECFRGVHVALFPVVVLSPDLTTPIIAATALKQLQISRRSTLILLAESVEIQGLELDGALEVRAVPGARVRLSNLTIKNRGWAARQVDPTDGVPAELAIRGFCFDKRETLTICVTQPGDHVVDQARLADAILDPECPERYVLRL